MSKCARCGRHHENEFLTFCHNCAKKIKIELEEVLPNKIEKEIEDVLPKKELKEFKKRPLFYLFLDLSLTFLILLFFSGLLFLFYNMKLDRDNIAAMNVDLSKKANELNVLQESLSKSEEGLRQIEAAKIKVEEKNKELNQKATSTDQIVTKVNNELSDTQNKLILTNSLLEKKAVALDQLNLDLAQKQNLSDKESRFARKFAEAQEILPTFLNKIELVIQYLSVSDYENANTNLTSSMFYYDQIVTILNDLKSGNY